ncbi:hypothetical protein [Methanogenium cariaci]|uniref:hypothetical protein n=1 Tax=Methanogenium cariaci TaxID=2197 RepID=UPI0009F9EC2A|nr:hypothetical protein [Methanogenium cariaci]
MNGPKTSQHGSLREASPEPVLADSGNGAHLLYAIDLPNDGEATRLVKACLTVLDALFSDDTVHCDTANFNAGRIWKLYGTTARKGDNTPPERPPHRTAQICSAPPDAPQVVTDDLLQDLADTIPPRSAPPSQSRANAGDRLTSGGGLTTTASVSEPRGPGTGGAPSSRLSNAPPSPPPTKTEPLPSSLETAPSLPDAITTPAAAAASAGRN